MSDDSQDASENTYTKAWTVPDDLVDFFTSAGHIMGGTMAAIDNSGREAVAVDSAMFGDGLALLHGLVDGFLLGFTEATDDSEVTDFSGVVNLLSGMAQIHEVLGTAQKMLRQVREQTDEHEDMSRSVLQRTSESMTIRVAGQEFLDEALLEVAKRGGSLKFVDIGNDDASKVALGQEG